MIQLTKGFRVRVFVFLRVRRIFAIEPWSPFGGLLRLRELDLDAIRRDQCRNAVVALMPFVSSLRLTGDQVTGVGMTP